MQQICEGQDQQEQSLQIEMQNVGASLRKREDFAISMRKEKKFKMMLLKRRRQGQEQPHSISLKGQNPFGFNTKGFSHPSNQQASQKAAIVYEQDFQYWGYKPWREDNYQEQKSIVAELIQNTNYDQQINGYGTKFGSEEDELDQIQELVHILVDGSRVQDIERLAILT